MDHRFDLSSFFASLFRKMNPGFFFQNAFKSDWQILGLVSEEEFKEMLAWAFGPNYGAMTTSDLADKWNELHSDIYFIKGSDYVWETMHRIGAAWKKRSDLTEDDVQARMRCGYTEPQARRLPGWHEARHRDGATMREGMELRDETGQVIRYITKEAYQKEFSDAEPNI